MLYILLVGVPLLAFLWSINFTLLLKKLHADKNTRNQSVLGALFKFYACVYSYVCLCRRSLKDCTEKILL